MALTRPRRNAGAIWAGTPWNARRPGRWGSSASAAEPVTRRSATALAEAIRSRELSAREVVEAHIEVLERAQPRINAIAAGWQSPQHLEKVVELEPLRSREDFRKLVAELKAETPKKK